jgi:hypothetical protein
VLVVQLKGFKWVISKDGFPDCRWVVHCVFCHLGVGTSVL